MSQDTWHTLQTHLVGFKIFVLNDSTVFDIATDVFLVKCSHGIFAGGKIIWCVCVCGSSFLYVVCFFPSLVSKKVFNWEKKLKKKKTKFDFTAYFVLL